MNNQFDVLAILVEYHLDGTMVSDIHIVVDIVVRILLDQIIAIPFRGCFIPEEGLAHIIV